MCSIRLWTIAVALVAALGASLPTLMSLLLRHMFTAPHQQPWPYGSLRLINVSGIPAQPLFSAERMAELSSSKFQHHKDDVWVISYPKSGTTWTIGILAALWNHPAALYSGNMQKITRTFCPQPELPDLGWGDEGFGHSIEELNAWPQPRCFKSHWSSRDFLAPSDNGPKKVIYVMRNAQDQMISHWNQVWGMGFHYGTENVGFEEGWDTFVEDWLEGNAENAKYVDHVAGWYKRSQTDSNNVMVVRYEDLKRNTDETILKIAQFVNVPMDEQVLARVKDQTSFERMRQADEKDLGLQFMRRLGVLRKKHIRQGETGGGELKLSPKHKKALEREYERALQPLRVPREWVLLED